MGKYAGFESVQLRKPTRSTFDLSHEIRLSTRMGRLTPIFISETLPNDTFYGSSEILIKLAPMLAPVMHRINMYVHYFFVPNRLLWSEWETFITGGRLGNTVPPVPPNMTVQSLTALAQGYLDKRSVWDYMGGTIIEDADGASWGSRTIDVMPLAAFRKIFFDYYRDRNFIADDTLLPLPSGTLAGPTYGALFNPRYRCWEHDYFTSSLPWTQRGAEVLVPMVGTADTVVSATTGLPVAVNRYLGIDPLTPGKLSSGTAFNPAAGAEDAEIQFDNTEISINDLRRAVRLQEWLERNALAGSRYNESIMAHFARKTSDSRLQRAEYLGGGKAVVKIGEVMTTAYSEDSETENVPPANPYGKGEGYSNTNKFSYNCEEHGFIIGVLSVLPTSGYMQGIPRMFRQRNTFLDYPWPSFAHLGEQEVYNSEIYGTPTSAPVDRSASPIFGYQSRYADWKYIPSRAGGDFRENLDFWHLTRKFSSQPVLGATFNTFEDALQDRIFNVSGVDTLWIYAHNAIKVKRSLPYFGTPQL